MEDLRHLYLATFDGYQRKPKAGDRCVVQEGMRTTIAAVSALVYAMEIDLKSTLGLILPVLAFLDVLAIAASVCGSSLWPSCSGTRPI